MAKDRSDTENQVLKVICSVLTEEALADVKEEDIRLLVSRTEKGELSLSYLRGLTADQLFDLIVGQMRFF